MNENCARWINAHAPSPLASVEDCIKEHKKDTPGLGPGCNHCPEYPKEWDTPQPAEWPVKL